MYGFKRLNMCFANPARIIRFSARIAGTFLVTICLFIFIGNLIVVSETGAKPEIYNVIVFNILAALSPVEGSMYIFILLIFLIPSIPYLSYWWLKRNQQQ